MAYIRDKKEELTGVQSGGFCRDLVDFQFDFVMVYGLSDDLPEKIRTYRERGYRIHLMTGVAWGRYDDYLDGNWDGRKHWDEAQTRRDGSMVAHDPRTPYIVPTISYAEYLTDILKPAVDAGVEAIHLEEPEYWNFGGYAEAFKREYMLFYNEPWQPVNDSVDQIYRSGKLMAYLYARTLERVSQALREYAAVKYHRVLRFYVATHSLISYSSIQMVSPESLLLDIPTIDGYIAQVWSGTSRSSNEYQGVIRERTFETGFLEYGIMQELTKGTGRRMWFLHDPIEDIPMFGWECYERNYIKTVAASLYHPLVSRYEVMPWPDRIFDLQYPHEMDGTLIEGATKIPDHYRTKLANIINMLGDMEQKKFHFENLTFRSGILMADSSMYQRELPDEYKEPEEDGFHRKVVSYQFPDFFGLAMPLVKYGLPLRPVQLDNIRRFPSYLNDYEMLVLSYEFCKPSSPEIHTALSAWVQNGGALVYVGDGSDPFHTVKEWWNTDSMQYRTPAEHLFESMGLEKAPKDGTYPVEKGSVTVLNRRPARLAMMKEGGNIVRDAVQNCLRYHGYEWKYTNHMVMQRGPYRIVTCMDESVDDTPYEADGRFLDMTNDRLTLCNHITVEPDHSGIYFDLDKLDPERLRVLGTSVRILTLTESDHEIRMECAGPSQLHAVIKLFLPHTATVPVLQSATSERSGKIAAELEWDPKNQIATVSFLCNGGGYQLCLSTAK